MLLLICKTQYFPFIPVVKALNNPGLHASIQLAETCYSLAFQVIKTANKILDWTSSHAKKDHLTGTDCPHHNNALITFFSLLYLLQIFIHIRFPSLYIYIISSTGNIHIYFSKAVFTLFCGYSLVASSYSSAKTLLRFHQPTSTSPQQLLTNSSQRSMQVSLSIISYYYPHHFLTLLQQSLFSYYLFTLPCKTKLLFTFAQ